MIDFFSRAEKNFDFLLEKDEVGYGDEPLFTPETVQLLYATTACQARNEIRENHSSDATYCFSSASDCRTLLSSCTFGLEDGDGSSAMDTTTSTTATTIRVNPNPNPRSASNVYSMHHVDDHPTGISFSDISLEPIPGGNPLHSEFVHSDEDYIEQIIHDAFVHDDDDEDDDDEEDDEDDEDDDE